MRLLSCKLKFLSPTLYSKVLFREVTHQLQAVVVVVGGSHICYFIIFQCHFLKEDYNLREVESGWSGQ